MVSTSEGPLSPDPSHLPHGEAPWGPNQPASPEHLLAFIVSAGDNCARQLGDTVGPAAGITPPHMAQSLALLPRQEGQQPAGQRS